jgi:rhodanese-related sulfurtransferase
MSKAGKVNKITTGGEPMRYDQNPYQNQHQSYYQNIDAFAAQRLISGGYGGRNARPFCRILDVREPEEFERGHLSGAVNVPLHQIGLKVPRLMPNRKMPLLVYCGSGARSLPAVQVLSVMGYTNLYNLQKGVETWPYRLER